MYAAVILIQILAVSVGGYVNFVLEGPCPENIMALQSAILILTEPIIQATEI